MRTFNKVEDVGDFVIAPEGTQVAVLICLGFLGTHESSWQGEVKTRELVGLSWELGEPGPDGRRLAVSETVTASLHEKSKFFSRVLALCGGREPPPGYDLAGLLGRGAVVTVSHVVKGDKTFANVVAVGPLPRGLPTPAPSVPPVFFDNESPDPAAYAAMPSRFRKLADAANGGTPAPAATWAGQAGRPAPQPAPAPTGWHPPQAAAAGYPPVPAGQGYPPQAAAAGYQYAAPSDYIGDDIPF